MNDPHPRLRNVAVLTVLVLFYLIPALFLPNDVMLDVVSAPLLLFGVYSIILIAQETGQTFWDGQRNRAALALYGLFALFLSVIITRSYGLISRNTTGLGFLDDTHVYSAALYIQFVGLYLFSQASTPAPAPASKTRYGQLITGIIIGALIASSRALEPLLMFLSKLWGRIF